MKKCPVCNAQYRGRGVCHRCRTDLSALLTLEACAERSLELAMAALKRNDYASAGRYARRSLALKQSPEALKLSGLLKMASQ